MTASVRNAAISRPFGPCLCPPSSLAPAPSATTSGLTRATFCHTYRMLRKGNPSVAEGFSFETPRGAKRPRTSLMPVIPPWENPPLATSNSAHFLRNGSSGLNDGSFAGGTTGAGVLLCRLLPGSPSTFLYCQVVCQRRLRAGASLFRSDRLPIWKLSASSRIFCRTRLDLLQELLKSGAEGSVWIGRSNTTKGASPPPPARYQGSVYLRPLTMPP